MSNATGTNLGIEFTETMRGFFSTDEKDDFQRPYDRGRQTDSPLEFTVTVKAENLDRLVDDAKHEARISGTVTAPAISDQPLAVEGGSFTSSSRTLTGR